MSLPAKSLSQLKIGESAILDEFDLPEEMSLRLMQMGMVPGALVEAAHVAPAGDPTVYRVDGTEIALRRETCMHIGVRSEQG